MLLGGAVGCSCGRFSSTVRGMRSRCVRCRGARPRPGEHAPSRRREHFGHSCPDTAHLSVQVTHSRRLLTVSGKAAVSGPAAPGPRRIPAPPEGTPSGARAILEPDKGCVDEAERLLDSVRRWNERKRCLCAQARVRTAWQRLSETGLLSSTNLAHPCEGAGPDPRHPRRPCIRPGCAPDPPNRSNGKLALEELGGPGAISLGAMTTASWLRPSSCRRSAHGCARPPSSTPRRRVVFLAGYRP